MHVLDSAKLDARVLALLEEMAKRIHIEGSHAEMVEETLAQLLATAYQRRLLVSALDQLVPMDADRLLNVIEQTVVDNDDAFTSVVKLEIGPVV